MDLFLLGGEAAEDLLGPGADADQRERMIAIEPIELTVGGLLGAVERGDAPPVAAFMLASSR